MYKQYQPPTPSFLVINFFPPSSLLSYPIDSAPDVSIQLSNLERKREDSSPESKRAPNEITKRNNLPKLAHESRIPLYSNSPPLLPHGPLTYFSETWFSQENLISSFAKTIIPADNGGTREVGKGVGWTDAVI